MYAVIKTGGKQYRVAAGDLLKVEKLAGEPGAAVKFNEVLMIGDTVGAPLVEGAVVEATLIETRKDDKVRIFKKTRRQGYRRTRGHRQQISVLRVTSILGAGTESKWEGTVSLVTKAELDARARGLATKSLAEAIETEVEAHEVVATPVVEPVVAAEAPKKKAAPKKAAAETETAETETGEA